VAVTPEQIEQAQPQPLTELPRTGSATDILLFGSGVFILLGGLALAAGRRRPSTGNI
jgi:LPXTG-motif cell wall-anchored protein